MSVDALTASPIDGLLALIAALDRLPDYGRAMLASALLVLGLRALEKRIDGSEVQFGASFRKAALFALLAVPLLVVLFPSSRMVVFVEEMPATQGAAPWGWRLLLLLWTAGFLCALFSLGRAYGRQLEALRAGQPVEDAAMLERLGHWQRRLGMRSTIGLVSVPEPRPVSLPGSRCLAVPAAALHWPAAPRDALLILKLCHLRRHHGVWHLLAQLVACCYWPVTWVQGLHQRLLADLELMADGMAESCFQDKLGYGRALRQLEQRMSVPASQRAAPAPKAEGRVPLRHRLDGYLAGLKALLQPAAALPWNVDAVAVAHERREGSRWGEPYERVVLFVGQAVFLALFLTGMTLKPLPPEVERTYLLPFEFAWMENFHRNLERQESSPSAKKEAP
jgi:hypothetical protein